MSTSPRRRGQRRALGVALTLSAVTLLLAGCAQAEESTDGSAQAVEEPTPEAPDDAPTGEVEEDARDVEEPSDAEDAAPEPAPEEPDTNLVATSEVEEIEAFAEPDEASEVTHVLEHPTARGAPRVFLVDERREGWLKVLLPVRPNGTTGWIRSQDVTLSTNPYSIDIDLAAFSLTIERSDEVVLETEIGYGADDTPTPGGRYYLIELLQPPDPSGVYGPYAYGLSGFSDVHLDFAGGEGVIGIHGTNDPGSIGETVSNGCIRIHNDVISEMATFLPLGTPVTIN